MDAVAYDNIAYFRLHHSRTIFKYEARKGTWSKMENCLADHTSVVILPDHSDKYDRVEFILHTVGGCQEDNTQELLVDDLYQYKSDSNKTAYNWEKSMYPHMKEARKQVTAVWDKAKYLIVAGGKGYNGASNCVELLNLTNRQWLKRVAELPRAVFRASGIVSEHYLYILGGREYDGRNFLDQKFAYKAPLNLLIEFCQQHHNAEVFQNIKEAPFLRSAYTTVSDQLLTVGGTEEGTEEQNSVNLVHLYDTVKDIWKPMKYTLKEARCYCFAVSFVHPARLMVVGGNIKPDDRHCIDLVEFAESASS